MKQQLHFRRFLSAVLFLAVSTFSWPYSFKVDGIYYNINSDKTSVTVTNTNNNYGLYSGSISIPSQVTYNSNTYDVTSIGGSAFSDCSGLTSITIPNSVTSIGNYAFSKCSGLTSVTIPNSVTSIGNYAFRNCSGLTSVTIPNSVTSIGEDAFDNTAWYNNQPDGLVYAGKIAYKYKGTMPSGTHITLDEGTLGITSYAFSNCSGLKSVTIGNSVTSIGSYAFRDCSGLTSVTIGNSVTSIGESAFYNCSGLTKAEFASIESLCNISFGSSNANPLYYSKHLYINGQEVTDLVIPNSVTSIGQYALYNCSGLKSVTIPNSVTSIGEGAFSGCSGLTSVTIPNSVTSIGSYAFYNCSGLTSVTIPSSVTSIGGSAFYCSGLTSINVENGNPQYDSRDNCNAIIKTSTNTLVVGCQNTTIPSSVTSIGASAFYGCSSLVSIDIPNSVTSIGSSAFRRCNGLTSIDIPNSVTSIGQSAFDGCSGLTSVTIPNSVTSIGNYAFRGCSGLTSVTIPNSVTSIGGYAFYGCSGLTSIDIPNSVTSIGGSAFSGCSGLTSVTCQAKNVPSTGTSVFSNVPQSTATLYVPEESVNAYQSANQWKDFGTILPIVEPVSILGDANGNGEVEIGDVTSVLTLMATPEATGYDAKAADANGNGEIEIGDVTTILTIMAKGGE